MIIGSKIIFIMNLSSTNTYAASISKKSDLKEGTVIQTNYQTAGRGQMENSWESEEGKNLLISIILFPSIIKPVEQFLISKTISLGLCDFLHKNIDNVSIKWPNDIYVNHDKIAGILIELSLLDNKIESAIAGIGLNINQKEFKSNAPNPISLSQLTGKHYDLDYCLTSLTSNLDKRYKQLLAENKTLIDSDYISNLYRYHEWAEFKDINGIFVGRIISVTDTGRLQVEKRRGRIHEYAFKEVEFI
jgi:BirA family biotin operon repressor/biotin-[acetyl-CoA-carboxylase] ligase